MMKVYPTRNIIAPNEKELRIDGSLNFSITNQTNVTVVLDDFKVLPPNATIGYEVIPNGLYYHLMRVSYKTEELLEGESITGNLILSETKIHND